MKLQTYAAILLILLSSISGCLGEDITGGEIDDDVPKQRDDNDTVPQDDNETVPQDHNETAPQDDNDTVLSLSMITDMAQLYGWPKMITDGQRLFFHAWDRGSSDCQLWSYDTKNRSLLPIVTECGLPVDTLQIQLGTEIHSRLYYTTDSAFMFIDYEICSDALDCALVLSSPTVVFNISNDFQPNIIISNNYIYVSYEQGFTVIDISQNHTLVDDNISVDRPYGMLGVIGDTLVFHQKHPSVQSNSIWFYEPSNLTQWQFAPTDTFGCYGCTADISFSDSGFIARGKPAYIENHDYQVWAYEHSNESSWIEFSISNIDLSNSVEYDSRLYFEADIDPHGKELWCYDYSNRSAWMVMDISPLGDSKPRKLTVWDNSIYFRADSGDGFGTELWVHNPLNDSTWMFDDINPDPLMGDTDESSYPESFTTVGGCLYFIANKGHNIGSQVFRLC